MKMTENEKRKLIDNNARITVKNFLTTIGTHIAERGDKRDLWDYGIMALMREIINSKEIIVKEMYSNEICACCSESHNELETNCECCPVLNYLDE